MKMLRVHTKVSSMNLKGNSLQQKKEILISFFHEVCEELQHNVDTEENVILEDDQYEEKDCSEQQ